MLDTNLPNGILTKVYSDQKHGNLDLACLSFPNAISKLCHNLYFSNDIDVHNIKFSVSSMKNWGAGRIQFRGYNTLISSKKRTLTDDNRTIIKNDKKTISVWFLNFLDDSANIDGEYTIVSKRLSHGSSEAYTLSTIQVTPSVYFVIDIHALFSS